MKYILSYSRDTKGKVQNRHLRIISNTIQALERMLSKNGNEQMISNSQLYKMAGNSIVTDCLYYLFEQIWYPKASTSLTPKQLSLF